MNTLANLNLVELMETTEKVRWLTDKISQLEEELETLKKPNISWVSIEEASVELKKSVSAIRQRIKHKGKPMPKGKVWRQATKGHSISINVSNYRKYM